MIDHNCLMMKKSYLLYLLVGFILAVVFERFILGNNQPMEDSSSVLDDALLKDEIITPNGIFGNGMRVTARISADRNLKACLSRMTRFTESRPKLT